MHKDKDKNVHKLLKRGFSDAGIQHNGHLFARIDADKFIHRKVVDNHGMIRTYMPRRATPFELKSYRHGRN